MPEGRLLLPKLDCQVFVCNANGQIISQLQGNNNTLTLYDTLQSGLIDKRQVHQLKEKAPTTISQTELRVSIPENNAPHMGGEIRFKMTAPGAKSNCVQEREQTPTDMIVGSWSVPLADLCQAEPTKIQVLCKSGENSIPLCLQIQTAGLTMTTEHAATITEIQKAHLSSAKVSELFGKHIDERRKAIIETAQKFDPQAVKELMSKFYTIPVSADTHIGCLNGENCDLQQIGMISKAYAKIAAQMSSGNPYAVVIVGGMLEGAASVLTKTEQDVNADTLGNLAKLCTRDENVCARITSELRTGICTFITAHSDYQSDTCVSGATLIDNGADLTLANGEQQNTSGLASVIAQHHKQQITSNSTDGMAWFAKKSKTSIPAMISGSCFRKMDCEDGANLHSLAILSLAHSSKDSIHSSCDAVFDALGPDIDLATRSHIKSLLCLCQKELKAGLDKQEGSLSTSLMMCFAKAGCANQTGKRSNAFRVLGADSSASSIYNNVEKRLKTGLAGHAVSVDIKNGKTVEMKTSNNRKVLLRKQTILGVHETTAGTLFNSDVGAGLVTLHTSALDKFPNLQGKTVDTATAINVNHELAARSLQEVIHSKGLRADASAYHISNIKMPQSSFYSVGIFANDGIFLTMSTSNNAIADDSQDKVLAAKALAVHWLDTHNTRLSALADVTEKFATMLTKHKELQEHSAQVADIGAQMKSLVTGRLFPGITKIPTTRSVRKALSKYIPDVKSKIPSRGKFKNKIMPQTIPQDDSDSDDIDSDDVLKLLRKFEKEDDDFDKIELTDQDKPPELTDIHEAILNMIEMLNDAKAIEREEFETELRQLTNKYKKYEQQRKNYMNFLAEMIDHNDSDLNEPAMRLWKWMQKLADSKQLDKKNMLRHKAGKILYAKKIDESENKLRLLAKLLSRQNNLNRKNKISQLLNDKKQTRILTRIAQGKGRNRTSRELEQEIATVLGKGTPYNKYDSESDEEIDDIDLDDLDEIEVLQTLPSTKKSELKRLADEITKRKKQSNINELLEQRNLIKKTQESRGEKVKKIIEKLQDAGLNLDELDGNANLSALDMLTTGENIESQTIMRPLSDLNGHFQSLKVGEVNGQFVQDKSPPDSVFGIVGLEVQATAEEKAICDLVAQSMQVENVDLPLTLANMRGCGFRFVPVDQQRVCDELQTAVNPCTQTTLTVKGTLAANTRDEHAARLSLKQSIGAVRLESVSNMSFRLVTASADFCHVNS